MKYPDKSSYNLASTCNTSVEMTRVVFLLFCFYGQFKLMSQLTMGSMSMVGGISVGAVLCTFESSY